MTTLARALGAAAIVATMGAGTASAADPAYCNAYAGLAVAQYQMALAKGIPGIGFPRWLGDYNAHFSWCSLPIVSRQMGDAEIAARHSVIN
jgi:hypothetical protein